MGRRLQGENTEKYKRLPVYEHYDEDDESHDGGSDPDSHLSLQRKRGLGLAVVLHSAQGEVQVPHSHLETTETESVESELKHQAAVGAHWG